MKPELCAYSPSTQTLIDVVSERSSLHMKAPSPHERLRPAEGAVPIEAVDALDVESAVIARVGAAPVVRGAGEVVGDVEIEVGPCPNPPIVNKRLHFPARFGTLFGVFLPPTKGIYGYGSPFSDDRKGNPSAAAREPPREGKEWP
jgi:hypothetical protein